MGGDGPIRRSPAPAGWRGPRPVLVRPGASLRETYRAIDKGGMAIALIVDDRERLLGTVIDRDIRRGLLRGSSLDDRVDRLMKKNPVTAPLGTSSDELLLLMKGRSVSQVPLLDAAGGCGASS